ncbi:flagellar assembly protein FliW [bacterium]|nr:flagellar assembly protein FliW [bacterium]
MKISTTRFGELEIAESDLIHFSQGILGFPDSHSYFILESDSPSVFAWLQSADESSLCFIITDPFMFKSDYSVNLTQQEVDQLQIKTAQEIHILSIISANAKNSGKITANMMAPLVINATNKMGFQLIKEEYQSMIRFDIKPILQTLSKIEQFDTEAFQVVNF